MEKDASNMRSQCPMNCALEFFGDKWSLLIVRDLLFFHVRSFGQLLKMDEGISTGTLSSRISMLLQRGIISRNDCLDDKRAIEYRLSDKGRELEPVLVEMILWVAEHEMTDLPPKAVANLKQARSLSRAAAVATDAQQPADRN